MQLLKDEWDEADIIAELLPALSGYRPQKCLLPVNPPSSGGLLMYPKGQFYFITSLYNRISPAITAQLPATVCMHNFSLAPVAYRAGTMC
jgi:hypothetical protein